MALVLKDRVQETTTTTGTGTITLAGAVAGFQAFSAVGDGNTTYYVIIDETNNTWEVGVGTYTASGTTLSRDTVLASSNSGALVNFATGTKQVFVSLPAAVAGVGLTTSTSTAVQAATNKIGSRAKNTVYQNTSGYSLLVGVGIRRINSNANQELEMEVSADNSKWVDFNSTYGAGLSVSSSASASINSSLGTWLIPAGYYYRFGWGNSDANTVITTWWEQVQGGGVMSGLASFTVATLPSVTPAGQMIYISDESGGATPAFSDGTDWRRMADRAVVT